jgi:hypothetical protein
MLTDTEIEAFIRSFEDCSLPRSEWTHQKHLIAALWYLWHHPKDEATQRIRDGIQRYNRSQGNHTGYHETITLAWIAVLGRFLAGRDRAQSVSNLASEVLKMCNNKDFLSRFYSRDLLMSDEARHQWVPPDKNSIE